MGHFMEFSAETACWSPKSILNELKLFWVLFFVFEGGDTVPSVTNAINQTLIRVGVAV